MTSPSERPSQIRAEHLEMFIIIYIRQSSLEQLYNHSGSTEIQRALVEKAVRYGWPESRIILIDDDLGLSGSIPGMRPGFQRMTRLVAEGRVSAIFVYDFSRLARNMEESVQIIELARANALILEVNGTLIDLSIKDPMQRALLYFQAVMACVEQELRTQRLQDGKRGILRKGGAVSPPPLGYVLSGHGLWALDPNEQVQEAIRLVFQLYLRLGSARRVAQHFRSEGFTFPRRQGGVLVWAPLTQLMVIRILRNRNYSPDYFYYVTTVTRGASGHRGPIPRPECEWVVVRDHHEGYVSRAEYAQIRAMLQANRRGSSIALRGGAALLHPILWCGRCGCPMKVGYDRRLKGKHLPAYKCHHLEHDRLIRCSWIPSERIDTVVVSAVVPVLSTAMDDIRAVADTHRREQDALCRARQLQLDRADAERRAAERRYRSIDPENKHVKAQCEAEWERAIEAQETLKRNQSRIPTELLFEPITDLDLERIHKLSQALETVWNESRISNEQRKQLLRAVLSKVVVREMTPSAIELELVWSGGAIERTTVLRSWGIDGVVREQRDQGRTDREIALELARRGALASGGRPFSRNVVAKRVWRSGLQHRVKWQAELARIRELVLAGSDPRAIVDELTRNGPVHWRGPWTLRIIQDAIRRLRRGTVHGVPQLPPDTKCKHRGTTDAEVVLLMDRWRTAGRPWQLIADELNRLGYRPARAPRFTRMQCITVHFVWRRSGRLARLGEPPIAG